jgi:acyl carrier protein
VSDTRNRLLEIFRDVFDDDDLELLDDMTSETIDEWDSLKNVKIMVRAEVAFDIEFKTSEVSSLQDYGTLVSLIEEKRRGKQGG